MKSRISLLAIITSLCFAAPMLQAEVCDGQIGAAYGLCTAYYDAVHCQQEPADGQSKACEKIARNFLEITGIDITTLDGCPCFNASDIDLLVQTCSDREQDVGCFENAASTSLGCDIGGGTLAYIAGSNNESWGSAPHCILRDPVDNDPYINPEVTLVERNACLAILRQKQLEAGLCDTGP